MGMTKNKSYQVKATIQTASGTEIESYPWVPEGAVEGVRQEIRRDLPRGSVVIINVTEMS